MTNTRSIILIGSTGNGKSTLGNVLVNKNGKFEEVFPESGSAISQTRCISEAAHKVRDGLSQILFVTSGRFTKKEIFAYDMLRKYIFDTDIVNYTTIVRTNFPNFRNASKCEEDKELMRRENGELAEIINSCGNRVIHVDNPSVNIDDERRLVFNREDRENSRTKLLSHLAQFQIVYKPANLDYLNSKIGNYMTDIERLQSDLNNVRNLSDEKKRQMQRTINELQEKVAQQARMGTFQVIGKIVDDSCRIVSGSSRDDNQQLKRQTKKAKVKLRLLDPNPDIGDSGKKEVLLEIENDEKAIFNLKVEKFKDYEHGGEKIELKLGLKENASGDRTWNFLGGKSKNGDYVFAMEIYENANPLEKSKYEVCREILIYQKKNKISDEKLAQQMELTLAETEDILYYRIAHFTLDRLLTYANKLFKLEPLMLGIVKSKEREEILKH
ncbi:15277_t:CDS:2 [Funneliformis geosporum]|uniref:15277_t:CDS:1 n=1 Tax=Funneliformis geosporum TaxID=1117311 RepID=A0A9W4SAC9_9GLOM|nr:15277_t:CDS:2 [Funneliformis geosporum]